MTPYFLGGYYLMKQRPIDFGSLRSKMVYTCSDCINDGLLDIWSYTWTTNNNAQIENIKSELQLNDDTILSIRHWVDSALNDKKIGWSNLFKDIHTVKDFRQKFYSHLSDVLILGIYFAETEMEDLYDEFRPQAESSGSIGLYENLLIRIPEAQSDLETFIGFDIIGIEIDGGLHTFYCHDISKDLIERFDLEINQYGLFNDSDNWKSVIEYMNAEENGFEPVPWFVCKLKFATT